MGMSRVVVVIVVVDVVVGVEVVEYRQGRAEDDALGWCRWDPGQQEQVRFFRLLTGNGGRASKTPAIG
jgi:hypothetical protein